MKDPYYTSKIIGFRFLKQRILSPVSVCFDFQITEGFSIDSARKLIAELPGNYQLCYLDPEEGLREESWIFVRQNNFRFYIQKTQRGASKEWIEQKFETVVSSFMASPLVKKPLDQFESFTISSIPEHQRCDHIKCPR